MKRRPGESFDAYLDRENARWHRNMDIAIIAVSVAGFVAVVAAAVLLF